MATYIQDPVATGTHGETVWRRIRDLLVANESVEVVVVSTGESESFELRAWTGVRADGSNGPDASPATNY